MLTLTECLHDESEGEESKKDDIEFIEAGEDAAEAFELAEEPVAGELVLYGTIPGVSGAC